ncbi:Origin recognition complex subunit 5 [Neolecta irregularis DAH-3]|uniref:Origin recognition complex subunit 5 n=1 Tax=Neolecta irregularis (strain DAH-3) TaxID=1198029 RepID=A0A1U7LH42_NEOID|nr:Origin recognition complex subunit 5 [Neolecta irregularis DAH-3]|eukprot:OLL21967.1 Origin recognition complex subunit 5 [Neolecta irregularis DAH-3]
MIDQLVDLIPGRDSQIQNLIALISEQTLSPSNLIVHGPPNTGKSLVLKELLTLLERPAVWKSCLEFFTPRLLFDSIITEVARLVGSSSKLPAVDSLTVLQSSMAPLLKDIGRNIALILDDADELLTSNFTPTTLSSLLRLSELTEANLTVILVFRSFPFRQLGSLCVPSIHFPPYGKENIVRILKLCLAEESFDRSVYEDDADLLEEVWQAYLDVIVEGYSNLTWDLCDLRSLALRLWPLFLEPAVEGRIEKSDWVRLYRAGTFLFSGEKFALEGIQFKSDVQSTHQLPAYGKFLLLAAYLASHNPSKLDARFFSKSREPGRKRKFGSRPKANIKVRPS